MFLCKIFGHKWKETSVHTDRGWRIIPRCKRCGLSVSEYYKDFKYEWIFENKSKNKFMKKGSELNE